jgi:hypothetical protein
MLQNQFRHILVYEVNLPRAFARTHRLRPPSTKRFYLVMESSLHVVVPACCSSAVRAEGIPPSAAGRNDTARSISALRATHYQAEDCAIADAHGQKASFPDALLNVPSIYSPCEADVPMAG